MLKGLRAVLFVLFPFQLLVLSVFLKKIFTPLTELHRTALIKEHRTFCLYPRHGLLAGGGLPAVMASQTSETARSHGRYRVFSSAGPKGFPYRYTVHGDTGSNLPPQSKFMLLFASSVDKTALSVNRMQLSVITL